VSFAVLVMKLTGILHVVAKIFAPVFGLFNMPGESALVFVTSCLLNIYSCIAVIEMLDLGSRTITILALMCLISHTLPVESAIQKKTGSRLSHILVVRLCASFTAAFALNLLLPPENIHGAAVAGSVAVEGFFTELKHWIGDISLLCAKIMVLITLLMILQRVLEEFGVIRMLGRVMKYPLMALGIPQEAAFLWIVANVLGLTYGSGVMVDHVDRGYLSMRHADILNHHIAVSHSLLEDTLLFVAIGVSVWWITIPRVILAGIVVWLKRLVDWVSHGKTAAPDAPEA
jgi:spore maturation protein SpmB